MPEFWQQADNTLAVPERAEGRNSHSEILTNFCIVI
jgi:hypothetical protein